MTLQTIGILLTGLTVSIAAIYYTLTLRYTRRNQDLQLETRQAQLFMQVYREVCTPEWWQRQAETWKHDWSNYEEVEDFMGMTKNTEAYAEQSTLFAFFEGLGVLVNRKLIHPSLVDDLLSGPILGYWERLRPHFLERRKRRKRGAVIAEWVEYLYNQIKPLVEEQHPELKT